MKSVAARAHRLVIPRLPEGSVEPAGESRRRIDPPALAGVRLVFGVGSTPDREPCSSDFHPVYTVAMPVFSTGGLDPDGVYEFDAGAQLELLQSRATRRRWGVRIELELVQAREAVNAAELWVDTPWPAEHEAELAQLGPERGEALDSGGRRVVVASSPATSVAAARTLGGVFRVQLRDVDPRLESPASVESSVFEIALDLRCYEFEAEARELDGPAS